MKQNECQNHGTIIPWSKPKRITIEDYNKQREEFT